VLVYTTIANIFERPDGVKIASVFILAIIVTSVASRAHRATELRVTGIDFDDRARDLVSAAAAAGAINLIANMPQQRDEQEYRDKVSEQRADNHLPVDEPFLFLEVTITDPSDFASPLRVFGEDVAGYHVLRLEASTVAQRDRGRPVADPRRPPDGCRTSTSAGPRATRSRTCCGTCSSATARSHR